MAGNRILAYDVRVQEQTVCRDGQGRERQVRELAHLERLLVGMALATWITLLAGTQVGEELLAKRITGRRRTQPWVAKQSLFSLGRQMLRHAGPPSIHWQFSDWQTQITAHHAKAYVFAVWHLTLSCIHPSAPELCREGVGG